MENKVYIIHDNCIWDDESCPKLVGATTNLEVAKELLKKYIVEVKNSIDFDSIDLVNEDIESDYDDIPEECWIYSESDTHFSLYQSGNYNSNHISINIEQLPLCNDLENEYEINNENSL